MQQLEFSGITHLNTTCLILPLEHLFLGLFEHLIQFRVWTAALLLSPENPVPHRKGVAAAVVPRSDFVVLRLHYSLHLF
jgi:hypothetical protein